MDVHDVTHDFERFNEERDVGVGVGPRQGSAKLSLSGLFPGARVSRGRDWDADDADGGPGGGGVMIELLSPESGSARNAVRVSWDSGQSLQHRLGLQGKVDLLCTEEAPGPTCYPSHLPELACRPLSPVVPGAECAESDVRLGNSDRKGVGVNPSTSAAKAVGCDVRVGDTVRGEVAMNATTPAARAAGCDVRVKDTVRGEVAMNATTPAAKAVGCDVRVKDTVRGEVEINATTPAGKAAGCDVRVGNTVRGEVGMNATTPAAKAAGCDVRVKDTVRGVAMNDMTSTAEATGSDFKVGDTVRVEVGVETLRTLQLQKGGWTISVGKCVGKTGVVKAVTRKGEVEVDFAGQKWRINPQALTKEGAGAAALKVGDTVRILSDENRAKEFLQGRTNWSDKMRKALGKVGRLVEIDADGDYRVEFADKGWYFHPACCLPAPGCPVDAVMVEAEASHSPQRHREEVKRYVVEALTRKGKDPESIQAILDFHEGSTPLMKLFRVIDAGRIDKVTEMLEAQPELVQASIEHGTALHYAAYKGQLQALRLLAAWGADVNKGDASGRTPMMRALDGNEARAVEVLIEMGADVNLADENGCTALHRSLHEDRRDICHLLLQHRADVNKQDKFGDMPLFDAVRRRSTDPSVLDAMLATDGLDLHVVNKKGFKAIHVATLKDRYVAVEKLLTRDPGLVNAKERDESYLPIHIAANNDYTGILHLLIRNGSEINPRTRIGEIPLHMSCTKVCIDSVMILVEKGADLNAQDRSGDSPLHNCFAESRSSLREMMRGGSSRRSEAKLQVANYLIQMGARTDLKNRDGRTALDLAPRDLRERIQLFMQESRISRQINTTGTPARQPSLEEVPCNNPDEEGEETVTCVTCSQRGADVIFLPCAHKLVCRECGPRTQSCPECGQPVLNRVDTGGNRLEHAQTRPETPQEGNRRDANEAEAGDCKVQ